MYLGSFFGYSHLYLPGTEDGLRIKQLDGGFSALPQGGTKLSTPEKNTPLRGVKKQEIWRVD